jgi:hypothetical protein
VSSRFFLARKKFPFLINCLSAVYFTGPGGSDAKEKRFLPQFVTRRRSEGFGWQMRFGNIQ